MLEEIFPRKRTFFYGCIMILYDLVYVICSILSLLMSIELVNKAS